ncbi:CvpA family protein [Roseibium salinum]|uniref:CvpA family protein n=1 Tax=Roseibium salinum TaxID=1604349 RepID=A0ABT3R1P5_9HYPH|nr:CvpA family protein [Roseibium sp. DSM 29163]MCX2723177.1 CvpA family protein [Roseibium sp. DSM 29163]
MPITLLDGLLLVIMFISAVLAMIRGFVREVLSIASWVAAAAAAFLLYERVLPYAKQYISHDVVALGASAAAVFLVTLVVVSYITMRISDFVLDSRIGALDRTLGFVFGAVRGLLLVVVAMMFFNWFVQPDQQPGWVLQAKSRPVLLSIGERLVAVLPEDPEKAILDKIRDSDFAGGDAGSPAEEPAYSDTERQGLEQLTSDSN